MPSPVEVFRGETNRPCDWRAPIVTNRIAAAARIKVQAPRMALKIIDDAIQAHGGGGVSEDFGLAKAYASIRTLRIADGPDEVHARSIARAEFGKHAPSPNPANPGFSSGDLGVARSATLRRPAWAGRRVINHPSRWREGPGEGLLPSAVTARLFRRRAAHNRSEEA